MSRERRGDHAEDAETMVDRWAVNGEKEGHEGEDGTCETWHAEYCAVATR